MWVISVMRFSSSRVKNKFLTAGQAELETHSLPRPRYLQAFYKAHNMVVRVRAMSEQLEWEMK